MGEGDVSVPKEGPRHTKYYIPLESNPTVFTDLIHKLGASKLEFQDVLSLDPELLAFVSRPALALVFVFPGGALYDKYEAADEAPRPIYDGSGPDEDVMWYRQTIGNACGLYALLHAVSNGEARKHIEPNSILDRLITQCTPLRPSERALALEESKELEESHASAGKQGDSQVPERPEDPVHYHYICFVASQKNKHVYDMNGGRKGPVDTGIVLQGEDILSDKALKAVKQYFEVDQSETASMHFSLMALVSS